MPKKNLSTAQKKAKFRKNLRNYIGFSIFFIALNAFGGSRHFWAIYPILGWGIGVLIEYFALYGPLKDPETEGEVEEFDLERNRPPAHRNQPPTELRELDGGKGYREEDLV